MKVAAGIAIAILASPASAFIRARGVSRIALPAISTTTVPYSQAPRPAPTSLSLFSISPDDQWGLYAVVTSAAAAALRAERTTVVGKGLSGPVTAMLITFVLTNIGVLPPGGSVHLAALQGFVLRLATPLLLLGADLRKIIQETGVMLQAFLLGATGTLLGSVVAMAVLAGPLGAVGVPGDGWKVASALTAKNIGGGLNFFAVTNAVGLSPATVGAGLAVDNLLGLCYFPFVSWLAAPYSENGVEMATTSSAAVDAADAAPKGGDTDVVERMMTALAVGTITAAAAEALANAAGAPALSVPVATVLTVALATAAPGPLAAIADEGELVGKLLLLLFFASVGNASGTVAATVASAGAASLLAYGAILYAVHLSVVLGVGRLLRIPWPDLLVASNANVGNAATASSLATSKGWRSRLLPGILVGTLGNAVGTFAGLALGAQVLKPMSGF